MACLLLQDPLLHVALLKQEPGATFSLVAHSLPPDQLYAQGKHFCVSSSPAQFQVGVRVQAASFGSFEQWVVFDFGRRPVLLQKLKLQLGQAHSLGQLHGKPAPSHPQELDCWHTGNRHVVREVDWTPEQEALMAKYKLPSQAPEDSGLVWGPISRWNYRQRMHRFLYEEETARQQLVAK